MRDQTCAVLRAAIDRTRHTLVKKAVWGRVLLVASILGTLVYFYLPAERDIAESLEADEVAVLVAQRYVPAFTILKPEQLTLRHVPKSLAAPGALQNMAELHDRRGRSAFLAAVPIPAGQMINRAVLLERGRSNGLSSLIEPGTVAVSLSVDSTHGAGGWIEPGDTIAIFVTPVPTPGDSHPPAKLLFPMVRVLAVNRTRLGADRSVTQPPEDPELLAASASEASTLTLLLNPIQARTLIETREQSAVTVVLRGWGDEQSWTL